MLELSKNSHGVDITIYPFTTDLYGLKSLQIYEEVGGALPKGRASFIIPQGTGVELLTTAIEGILIIKNKNSNGISYPNIPIIITSRRFLEVNFEIDFICAPSKDFYEKRFIETYDSVQDAMEMLIPKNLSKSVCSSNINNKFKIYQPLSTKYEFLKKLAFGWRNNTLVGFSFSGFFIKPIDNVSNSSQDPLILGPSGTLASSVNNLIYSKEQNNNNPTILNEDDPECLPNSPNIKLLQTYDDPLYCNSGYEVLLRNYNMNKIYYKNAKYNSYSISNIERIPSYKLGDTIYTTDVIVKNNKLPRTNYIVWSNEFFIRFEGADNVSEHGLDFSWKSTLVGVDNSEKWSN